jgi:hypothetical protein
MISSRFSVWSSAKIPSPDFAVASIPELYPWKAGHSRRPESSSPVRLHDIATRYLASEEE